MKLNSIKNAKKGGFCSLCKNKREKLFSPEEKLVDTQLSNTIKGICGVQELNLISNILICTECALAIAKAEIIIKRISEALNIRQRYRKDELQETPSSGKDNWLFYCTHCEYTAKNCKFYKRHLKVKHNVDNPRIYKCMYCPKSYKRCNAILNHIAFKHEKKARPQPMRRKTTDGYFKPNFSVASTITDVSYVPVQNEKELGPISQRRKSVPSNFGICSTINEEVETSVPKNLDDLQCGFSIDYPHDAKGPMEHEMENIVEDNENNMEQEKDYHFFQPSEITKRNQFIVTKQSKLLWIFQCSSCDFTSTKSKIYKTHIEKQHDVYCSDIYKCPYCLVAFKRFDLLQSHVANKHTIEMAVLSDTPLKYSSSGRDYAVPRVIEDQSNTDHSIASISTDKEIPGRKRSKAGNSSECTSPFSELGTITKRTFLTPIQKEPNLHCEYCIYYADDIHNLREHISFKHQQNNLADNSINDIKYEDDICQKECQHITPKGRKRIGLNSQLSFHSKSEWVFYCSFCDFESMKKKLYKIHLINEHDVNDSDFYKCLYCSAAYGHYNLLQSHIATMHNIGFTFNSAPSITSESSYDYAAMSSAKKKRNWSRQT